MTGFQIQRQNPEAFGLAALLAFAGGYLDVYTYLSRGGVLANAQTGNIVLLGLHLTRGNWGAVIRYCIPIAAFVAGILLASLIRSRLRHTAIQWRQWVLLAEIAVLFGVGFIPGGEWDVPANSLVSLVCALQVVSFQKVEGISYASTMCTGNLRSGTTALYQFWQSRSRQDLLNFVRYYGIIFFFLLGAGAGTLLTGLWGTHGVWFCLLPLLGSFWMLLRTPSRFWNSSRCPHCPAASQHPDGCEGRKELCRWNRQPDACHTQQLQNQCQRDYQYKTPQR